MARTRPHDDPSEASLQGKQMAHLGRDGKHTSDGLRGDPDGFIDDGLPVNGLDPA
jgi:hypothetical protein